LLIFLLFRELSSCLRRAAYAAPARAYSYVLDLSYNFQQLSVIFIVSPSFPELFPFEYTHHFTFFLALNQLWLIFISWNQTIKNALLYKFYEVIFLSHALSFQIKSEVNHFFLSMIL
jgi:hypothetical protein